MVLGEVQPSKNYEAVLRHSIRVKLQTFEKLEVPLLVKTGFMPNSIISTGANAMLDLRGASGGNFGVSDAFEPATSTLPR